MILFLFGMFLGVPVGMIISSLLRVVRSSGRDYMPDATTDYQEQCERMRHDVEIGH